MLGFCESANSLGCSEPDESRWAKPRRYGTMDGRKGQRRNNINSLFLGFIEFPTTGTRTGYRLFQNKKKTYSLTERKLDVSTESNTSLRKQLAELSPRSGEKRWVYRDEQQNNLKSNTSDDSSKSHSRAQHIERQERDWSRRTWWINRGWIRPRLAVFSERTRRDIFIFVWLFFSSKVTSCFIFTFVFFVSIVSKLYSILIPYHWSNVYINFLRRLRKCDGPSEKRKGETRTSLTRLASFFCI
jgi:hypothetical protein